MGVGQYFPGSSLQGKYLLYFYYLPIEKIQMLSFLYNTYDKDI